LSGSTGRRRATHAIFDCKSDAPAYHPTGVYAPGCAIFGTATLTAAEFGTPLAYEHITVADNEGPGNATTGIADVAYYYKLVSAEFVACLNGQPTGHIRSLIYARRSSRRPHDGADRAVGSICRVALWLGGDIVAAATAWRSSNKQFWVF
jgi:hypothetical protein